MGSIAPALGSMALLLLMSGMAGLSGFALNNLEKVEAAQASLMHVYVRDGATNADVNSLWDRLSHDSRVASVNYVTRAQALARAQRIPGLAAVGGRQREQSVPGQPGCTGEKHQ